MQEEDAAATGDGRTSGEAGASDGEGAEGENGSVTSPTSDLTQDEDGAGSDQEG